MEWSLESAQVNPEGRWDVKFGEYAASRTQIDADSVLGLLNQGFSAPSLLSLFPPSLDG